MKIKSSIHYLLLIAVQSAFCYGCWSFRKSVTISVNDIGENITTRHRYHLIAANIRAENPDKSLVEKRRILKEHFPNVFSDDGIPFVLNYDIASRNYGRYGWIHSRGWTEALAACTLGIFPKQECTGGIYAFKIEMAKDDFVRADFDMIRAVENAQGVLPTAFLALNGKPDVGDFRVYWKSKKAFGESEGNRLNLDEYSLLSDYNILMSSINNDNITDPVKTDDQLSQFAFAYGVAGKLKELEDSGAVDAMLKRLEAATSKAPPHRVVTFKREKEKEFAYRFVLETEKEVSTDEAEIIFREFGELVKEDYAGTFPDTDEKSLFVEFMDKVVHGRRIEGRAAVLTMKPVLLSYDANTRRGKLSVRFNPGQYEEARAWARKNIETLARDKNIALVTGQIPPDAKYYSLGETVKDGNILEIEFKTE